MRNLSEKLEEKQENMRVDSVNSEKNEFVIMWFVKTIEHLHHQFCFVLYVYKMYLISAEGHKNGGVQFLRVQETGEIWASMKDSGSYIGVKNISDLILKEIHGVLKTKNPTEEQINKYKMTEREIYEKFDNLSEEELNTKSNKNIYVKNVIMTAIIKRCKTKRKVA